MALVRAPRNGFTRIMLSRLVLFAIDFPCKCFTVESPTIIMQGLFLCRVLGLLCSIISSLSDFLSTWSRGSLPLVLLSEINCYLRPKSSFLPWCRQRKISNRRKFKKNNRAEWDNQAVKHLSLFLTPNFRLD